jgi:hypothetical protein
MPVRIRSTWPKIAGNVARSTLACAIWVAHVCLRSQSSNRPYFGQLGTNGKE